jgi:hypothetical protein
LNGTISIRQQIKLCTEHRFFFQHIYSVGIAGGSCAFRLVPSVNTPNPDMAFSCNTVSPQMIIKNNGSIGVGTATPNDKFEINSGVTAHSVCVLRS